MDGLMYQRQTSRQFYYNGARFSYPSLHIDIGSVNIGSIGSVVSVYFRVRINLGYISNCHPLLLHQDTTLARSTILSICQVVQMFQRHTL